MKQIQVFISQPAIFSREERKQVKGPEFEARLYSESGSGTYFSGRGKSDAEAIGALVCRCPEQFNAEIVIVPNPDGSDS